MLRACPALAGLYPLVEAWDAAASTWTANVYDLSTGGQLNGGGAYASGTEISLIAAAAGVVGVLDMGHANVVADCAAAMAGEGAALLVEMIPDAGSTVMVRIDANDDEHVAALLFPDRTVFVDGTVTAPATTFPYGSRVLPVGTANQLATVLSARGYTRAFVVSSLGGSDGPTTAIGTAWNGVTFKGDAGPIIFPQGSNQVDVTDARFVGVGLSTVNSGSRLLGPFTVEDARVTGSLSVGGTASRNGQPTLKRVKIEGSITLNAGSAGCWTIELEDCTFVGTQTLNFTSMNGFTSNIIRCTGPFTIANMPTGKTMNVIGHQGSPTITIASSCSNGATFNFSGAIDTIVDQRTGATYNLAKLAHLSDLTGAVVTLAAGSITVTEAPTLDALISSRASPAQVAAELATYGVATGAAVAALPAPLDAAATATAVQTGLTAQGLTTTRAAFLDRLDAAVSTVAASVWAYVIGGVALAQDSAAKWLRAIATALHVHAVWDAASGDADGVSYNSITGAPDTTTTRKRGYAMAVDLSTVTTGGADDESSPDVVLTEAATLDVNRPDMPTTFRGTVA